MCLHARIVLVAKGNQIKAIQNLPAYQSRIVLNAQVKASVIAEYQVVY